MTTFKTSAKPRKPRRKSRCPTCKGGTREEEYFTCASCNGIVTFTVYDGTLQQVHNAKKFVQSKIQEYTKESILCKDMWAVVWHHEDDCILVSVRLFDYTGKTFLGWTKEAEYEHSKRFWYINQDLHKLNETNTTHFYSVCDGDKMLVKNHRVRRV